MNSDFLYKLNLPVLISALKGSLTIYNSLYNHPYYCDDISAISRLENLIRELSPSEEGDVLSAISCLTYIAVNGYNPPLRVETIEASKILALYEPNILINAIADNLAPKVECIVSGKDMPDSFKVMMEPLLTALKGGSGCFSVPLLQALKGTVDLYITLTTE